MSARAHKVAVIIPCYNAAKTIAACLDSVHAQTVPPAQIIVVDDASRDESRQILGGYPCTLLSLPANRGVSAARNLGASAVNDDCDTLFFLDADIALSADGIEQALAILDSDPDIGCVHGMIDAEPLFDDGVVERYHVLHAHHVRMKHIGRVSTAFFALAAIRRTAFEAAGWFDERLRDSEDTDYSDRLVGVCGIELHPGFSGRHDDVDRLGPLLSEKFRRSKLIVPVALANRQKRDAVSANHLSTLVLAAATPVGVLLGFWWPPLFALAPLLLFLLFAVSEPPLARRVLRSGGAWFALKFFVVHLLTTYALIAGALYGAGTGLRGGIRAARAPHNEKRAVS
jgi:GT2 family glycosyltransferase